MKLASALSRQRARALLHKSKFCECDPISTSFQIFTDTGMPISNIMFRADALTQACAFCCGSAHAFSVTPTTQMRVKRSQVWRQCAFEEPRIVRGPESHYALKSAWNMDSSELFFKSTFISTNIS